MSAGSIRILGLYVDHRSQQWIVLDGEENFWIVPSGTANPWDHRQPFYPTEDADLEPVPGHYKYMLGIPA